MLNKLLKKQEIVPSGYYHYDEQYPHTNGDSQVRLALVDAITNLPINELISDEKNFDKIVVKSFLESSFTEFTKKSNYN